MLLLDHPSASDLDIVMQMGNQPSTIGPYRIIRQLGEGGMGVVLEAVHQSIGRHVAIKILHAQYNHHADVVSRFLNEVRAVSLIDHPGLVQVWDVGRLPDGTPYFVMEYLKGESLAQRIKRARGALPLGDVLQIGWQLADSLAAAHDKGIIHRDAYRFSMTCFQVGHFRSQRRRNKPCPLTAAVTASRALT